VYNQLGNGIVELNQCRTISEVPIPFPFVQSLTLLIMIQWVITPLICASSVSNAMWASIDCFIVVLCFWILNYTAMELEFPFGTDKNDLPTPSMQRSLNGSLLVLMHERALKPPVFDFDAVSHSQLFVHKVNLDSITSDIFAMQRHSALQQDALNGKRGQISDVGDDDAHDMHTIAIDLDVVPASNGHIQELSCVSKNMSDEAAVDQAMSIGEETQARPILVTKVYEMAEHHASTSSLRGDPAVSTSRVPADASSRRGPDGLSHLSLPANDDSQGVFDSYCQCTKPITTPRGECPDEAGALDQARLRQPLAALDEARRS
jgi:hypothetical protein